jgi:hypothetical protein
MSKETDVMKGMNCIQFIMWTNCHISCDFCFYKHYSLDSDLETRRAKIRHVISLLNDEKVMTNPELGKHFDNIGLIGGDFFFNQLEGLESEWLELLSVLNNHEHIEEIWLATSLVFSDRKWLDLTIDNLSNKKILINTSWDPVGRFKNNAAFSLWESNVRYLLSRGITVPCTSILSQNFIDNFYKNDLPPVLFEMSSLQFFRASPLLSKKHVVEGTSIESSDVISELKKTDYQPGNFFIKSRNEFIKFCFDFIEKYGDAPLRYYVNESSHSSSIVTLNNAVVYNRWEVFDTPCKHEYVARQYSDSDACAYCDVKAILE